MVLQGHFTAPAKRLRAEHRRLDAERRPHGQFRPSDGRASLLESTGHPSGDPELGKVADMHSKPTIEPAGSPVSGLIPQAASSLARRNPASSALAKLLSVIHGDKYMVDAYPPAWHSAAGAARTAPARTTTAKSPLQSARASAAS